MFSRSSLLALLVVVSGGLLAGCGGDDDSAPAADKSGLSAIKTYLLDHTERLDAQTAALQKDAKEYHELAKSHDFDYAKLLADDRAKAKELVERMQATFRKANPAYEEMEGVVAGVPELADFDVTIDAGSDGSDPDSAVSFTLETPAGKTYKQPGNFFFLTETALWGTEPKFAAQGVRADLDGDGKTSFGEALPDADFLVTAVEEFHKTAGELQESAEAWEPTDADALTALVVMTPTMSEYFAAWKNSRFIAGSKADEKGFVAASRLQDIADILSGLDLIYDNVEPTVAKADAAQAKQTGAALKELLAFATRLRNEEADGKRFTASEADTLGTEAQSKAEAIAGQITQAAATLDIELQT